MNTNADVTRQGLPGTDKVTPADARPADPQPPRHLPIPRQPNVNQLARHFSLAQQHQHLPSPTDALLNNTQHPSDTSSLASEKTDEEGKEICDEQNSKEEASDNDSVHTTASEYWDGKVTHFRLKSVDFSWQREQMQLDWNQYWVRIHREQRTGVLSPDRFDPATTYLYERPPTPPPAAPTPVKPVEKAYRRLEYARVTVIDVGDEPTKVKRLKSRLSELRRKVKRCVREVFCCSKD